MLCAMAVPLLLSSCSAPIPREEVPAGWKLNVHQPGEWWTQSLIPRSVVVQRCPPPDGWSSEPDLTRETALPPGSSVNYMHWVDDYHCSIGWSEPAIQLEYGALGDVESENDLSRFCSTSGLPMDDSWRFLGSRTLERVGDPKHWQDEDETRDPPRSATAAFIDQYETVVACQATTESDSGWVELSVGTDLPGTVTVPKCPVSADNMTTTDDDTVESYQLSGAGAVRDQDGRVLTEAKTLRIGLAGDSVTSSHPIVDGIAIVAAEVLTKTAYEFDWDKPPPVAGQVLDADGKVLAACHS